MIPRSYKSKIYINITGVDKVHLKAGCIHRSLVVGTRDPILYSLELDKAPGYKIHEQPKVKLFKRINKSVLSHITLCLVEDDQEPVDFNGETKSFTCQLVNTWICNLKRTCPRNKTEDLLLSTTRNCETFIERTQKKTRNIRI